MKTYQEKILEDRYTVNSSCINKNLSSKEPSVGSNEARKSKNKNISSLNL
jgi:hypothetical protein